MLTDPLAAATAVFLAVAAAVFILGSVLKARAFGEQRRARNRLRGLATETAARLPEPAALAIPSEGRLAKLTARLVSRERDRLTDLRLRFLHAGFFRPSAPLYFLAVRGLLTVALAVTCGPGPYWAGLIAAQRIFLFALLGGGVGYLAPSYWLEARAARRQRALRHALPDALDMLVLCLEGGACLNAAMQSVTDELLAVHPLLGVELNIVQREMQLGLSAGDAMRKFADRCGLADVRELASVLLQSERYGASIAKALRIYADTARQERQVQAEEHARKAAVKVLYPTLLCIFPATFIVLLGPAAFQMSKLFAR
jgi:tight adherence protein C